MWTYSQGTGLLSNPEGIVVGRGYAGRGEGKNNPSMEGVKDRGPLPRGFFTIGTSYTHPRLGPITMNLEPDPRNEMFDREDFRIHGDSTEDPGEASDGCIVQDHSVRFQVSQSADRRLEVIK